MALRRMLVLNKSSRLRRAETSIRLHYLPRKSTHFLLCKHNLQGGALKLQPCVMGVRAKPLANRPIIHKRQKEFFTLSAHRNFVVVFSIIFGIKFFLRRFRCITQKCKFFFKNTIDNSTRFIYNAPTIEYRGEINSDS